VVEDELMIRMLLEDMLGELGYTIAPKQRGSTRRSMRPGTSRST